MPLLFHRTSYTARKSRVCKIMWPETKHMYSIFFLLKTFKHTSTWDYARTDKTENANYFSTGMCNIGDFKIQYIQINFIQHKTFEYRFSHYCILFTASIFKFYHWFFSSCENLSHYLLSILDHFSHYTRLQEIIKILNPYSTTMSTTFLKHFLLSQELNYGHQKQSGYCIWNFPSNLNWHLTLKRLPSSCMK